MMTTSALSGIRAGGANGACHVDATVVPYITNCTGASDRVQRQYRPSLRLHSNSSS
jgi:hypothetical protein